MKLDRIKFAYVASWLSSKFGDRLSTTDLEEFDNLIDIEPLERSEQFTSTAEHTNKLLELMQGDNMLGAIKQYRMLTGMPLQESKEMIKKYWIETAWTKDELIAKTKFFSPSRVAGTATDLVREFIESL